jgi:branched-subunit amino acid transport protein
MFYLIQSLVIGAVVVHNEYYQWTPNKLLAAIIGVIAAYLLTRVIWSLKRE